MPCDDVKKIGVSEPEFFVCLFCARFGSAINSCCLVIVAVIFLFLLLLVEQCYKFL